MLDTYRASALTSTVQHPSDHTPPLLSLSLSLSLWVGMVTLCSIYMYIYHMLKYIMGSQVEMLCKSTQNRHIAWIREYFSYAPRTTAALQVRNLPDHPDSPDSSPQITTQIPCPHTNHLVIRTTHRCLYRYINMYMPISLSLSYYSLSCVTHQSHLYSSTANPSDPRTYT